ncbi:MAG: hypothetical protein HOW73_41195 [Polyangiaceae bacterium]|nr:hypothetical protein [Polyangiaceae bacterium]
MASDYARIRRRASEDPGTAGDQVEEVWAEFLRHWLPPAYQVVTKGRLLDDDGETSPQLDVLVLHPAYPRAMLNQKLYFRGGVVAAFECKLTLKTVHLRDFFSRAARIKRRTRDRRANLHDELNEPPILGLLALGHSWRDVTGSGKSFIERVRAVEDQFAEHPRELPEFLVLVDVETLQLEKAVARQSDKYPKEGSDIGYELLRAFPGGGVATTYWAHRDRDWAESPGGQALGELITGLLERIARVDPSVRTVARYFSRLGPRSALGVPGFWHHSVLSRKVWSHLRRHGYDEEEWSVWNRFQP